MLSKILAWSALVLTILFAGVSLAGVFGGSALGGLGPTLILAGAAVAGIAALLATVVLVLGAFQS
jgi:hypothetical protein